MKKHYIKIFACFAALLLSNALKAAVTFPIDYNNFFAASAINSGGTSLETGNTAAVGTWAVGNAGTNAVSPVVSANNLSFSNYVDNNQGKKISLASLTTGSTARTTGFYLTSAVTDLTSGPYYLSFMLNVSSVTGSALNIISFGNSSTGGSLRGRVYIKAVTGGYLLGATIDGSPLSYFKKDTLKTGATNLIVLKHKIDKNSTGSNLDGSATTSIFVNPVLGGVEPAIPDTFATETSAVSGLDCIKSVVVSQNAGLAAEIAGIRLSNAWEDVAKRAGGPKLATPTVLTATAVGPTGFTANWTPVANALSYDVKIYQNGNPVRTTNAPGQSASSVVIAGLANVLCYTYTVTAVGDVTNFSNSDASPVQKLILPLNYSTFFASSAIASGETALETGNTSVVNTWTMAGTASGANPVISANDLSYLNFVDNHTSKKISLLSDVAAQRTSLFYLTSSATDLTTGIYYLGFLLRVNAAPSATATLLSFANSNTGGQRGRLNIMALNAGYQLAASLTGSSVYYASTLSFGTTYLVVLKHEISIASATAGEATCSVFVNPLLSAVEPVANATKTESGISSLDCVKAIVVNQQPGLAAEIASLRLSTRWEDVVKTGTSAVFNPEVKKLNVSVVSDNEWKINMTDISGLCQLTVINMQGQTIMHKNLNGGSISEIQVNLPKGLYLVTLQSNNDKYVAPVVSK